jgi:hypothetical protein
MDGLPGLATAAPEQSRVIADESVQPALQQLDLMVLEADVQLEVKSLHDLVDEGLLLAGQRTAGVDLDGEPGVVALPEVAVRAGTSLTDTL